MQVYIKRFFIWFTIVALTLLLGLNVLSLYFNKNFKSVLIKNLNNYLRSEVNINGGASFSFIKYFPNVAFEVQKVAIKETISGSINNCVEAENIILLFNMKDIIFGKFNVKQIVLEGALLNFIIDKNGKANYLFWNESDDNEQKFNLLLEELVIDDLYISYNDLQNKKSIKASIVSANLSGSFSITDYLINAQTSIHIDSLVFDKYTYFENKDIGIDIELNIQPNESKYIFKNALIDLEGNELSADGLIEVFDSSTYIKMMWATDIGDLASFFKLLPNQYVKKMQHISTEGDLKVNLLIDGEWSAEHNPFYELEAHFKEGHLLIENKNIELEQLVFDLFLTNGAQTNYESSKIEISNLGFILNNRPNKLGVKVLNFNQPLFDIVLDAEIGADLILPELDSLKINNVKGGIDFRDIRLSGRLVKSVFSNNLDSIMFINTSGSVVLNNINFDFNDQTISNISGRAKLLEQGLIDVSKISLNTANSDFFIKGKIKQLIPYLYFLGQDSIANKDVIINAILGSNKIDMNGIYNFKVSDSLTIDTSNNSFFDYIKDLKGSLKLRMQKLTFDHFVADSLSANITLAYPNITYEDLYFKAMSGTFFAKGNLYTLPKIGIKLETVIETKNIKLDQLYYQFNNFGQETIKSENLKGILNTKLTLNSFWNTDYVMLNDSLYVLADISIEKGYLMNLETLKKMSKFVKVKDLKKIEFSTLENNIEIKNRLVTIPAMKIVSTAGIMTISGSHTFSNDLDYQLKINLSSIISNKFKKNNKNLSEIENTKEGKLNLFLSVMGTVNEPIFKYDKKMVKEKIKQDLANEKKELLKIIKDEFAKDVKPDNIQDWEDEDELEIIDWDN